MHRFLVFCAALICPLSAAAGEVSLSFDAADLGSEGVQDAIITSPYHPLAYKEGVTGKALDLDGYSVGIKGTMSEIAIPMTVGASLALRSFPTGLGGIVQMAGEHRLSLAINNWGFVVASVSDDIGNSYQLTSGTALALEAWARVEVSIDEETIRLFLDAEEVARTGHGLADDTRFGPQIHIGVNSTSPLRQGVFPTGHLNGLIDDVEVKPGTEPPAKPPNVAQSPDLSIASSRFADDPHRPKYHPMPPAGWTNEPHGLLRVDDTWHIYYQANPSGPWWDLMSWGQLVSTDLIDWTPEPLALRPTPGFDQNGVWVGDVVAQEDRLAAVYTGVNGQWAGIGLAMSRGPDPSIFDKDAANPVIAKAPPGYQDMRDPFLTEDRDGWLMLVGSGIADGSRPEILTFRSDDLRDWTFEGPLDIGPVERFGTFWELPKLLRFGESWALFLTTVKPQTPARTQYWLGDWDGARFVARDPVPQWLDLLPSHLGHSFGQMEEGRYASIGVVPGAHRTDAQRLAAGWVHGFSLPRTVTLCAGGQRLCQAPLMAIDGLFAEGVEHQIPASDTWTQVNKNGAPGDHARVSVRVGKATVDPVEIAIRATKDLSEATILTYFPQARRLSLDFSKSSSSPTSRTDTLWADLPAFDGDEIFDIFIDASLVTLFTASGASAAFRVFPEGETAHHAFVRQTNGSGDPELVVSFDQFKDDVAQ